MSSTVSELPAIGPDPVVENAPPPKSASFWLSLLAITIATFLAALDTVSVLNGLSRCLSDILTSILPPPPSIERSVYCSPDDYKSLSGSTVCMDRVCVHFGWGCLSSTFGALCEPLRSPAYPACWTQPLCTGKCAMWRRE